ncbi:NAD-dependent epimerase [Sulfitobacter donghicola DSW-25 = KCTC 12864 = JCM 14565]|uniref:NAD-dependent epimerase n=1 Tax=Sulfitobacter donghicola DSW-25 = KCTC 12864 = JCM 14565 TaxID=1300350 RepID=A0A073ILW4_9RHOB|nr:NAD-dependent epimerase [Sulfitobacter donghicola DSW-25 = KCTC 12864 = JCM 14565]
MLLGAGGRLGRMLWENWPVAGQLKGQSRRKLEGMLQFDPLNDPEKLASAMAGVAAVVCLSGVTPAHGRASGDSMDLNKTLALAAVNSAPEGVRVFVASSAAVYGAAIGPHSEDTNVAPVSEYGAAKLAMEQAALAQGQGRTCVLRIGNVAGADAILGGWQEGMALDELPDGSTPRRSYIGARSLAHVVHRLCFAEDLPQIINIAAPGVVAMGDLLDAAGLAWTRRPSGDQTIPEVALETSRVERFYSFEVNECTPKGMVEQLHNSEVET